LLQANTFAHCPDIPTGTTTFAGIWNVKKNPNAFALELDRDRNFILGRGGIISRCKTGNIDPISITESQPA
jgi:hypothetical protein